QGDDLAKSDRPIEAIDRYLAALNLLPDDKKDWEAATWIYVAIGDVYFHTSVFDKCFESFHSAVQCPNGLGNPFIHLRLGQMYHEQGNYDKAADELARAYMGADLG